MKSIIHIRAVLAATFILLVHPIAHGAEKNTITTLKVPLTGTVQIPLFQGSDAFDTVTVSGRVQVVADTPNFFSPTPIQPLRLRVNLDHAKGIGSLTQRQYVATGSNRISLTDYPPGPIIFGFDLREVSYPPHPIFPPHPITPVQALPLDIGFSFDFNPDTGELSGVSVDSLTIPQP
jgi:hypothetical protein